MRCVCTTSPSARRRCRRTWRRRSAAVAHPTRSPLRHRPTLIATPVSQSQVNLSWTSATDNVLVVGYRVERCQGAGCSNFVEIAQPTATTYSGSRQQASTSYSYRVRAIDAALQPRDLLEHGHGDDAASLRWLGGRLRLRRGVGNEHCPTPRATGNTAPSRTAAWTTQGKFGNALEFQRDERPGDDPRRGLAAPHERDDPRGLGEPGHPCTSAWRDLVFKGNDNYYLMASSRCQGTTGRRWHLRGLLRRGVRQPRTSR